MDKTIQWLEVQIVQHMPGSLHRHAPIASGHSEANESAIREHLLSTVTCRTNYSAEFFSVLHRAHTKHHPGWQLLSICLVWLRVGREN